MGRSPGFGSVPGDSRPVRTRFRSGSGPPTGLNLATEDDSPDHTAKGTWSGLPRRSGVGPSHCLWAGGFRLYFTPLPGFFSPFPRGTIFAIGQRGVFSLGGWSPRLPAGFLESDGTQAPSPGRPRPFAYGAITLSGGPFQAASARPEFAHSLGGPQPSPRRPCNPPRATPAGFSTRGVWALPLSLAATRGISVDFFSSGY